MKRTKNSSIRTCLFILSSLLIIACDSPKSSTETASAATPEHPPQPVIETNYKVVKDKRALSEYYQLDHIKEWYPERKLPPAFNYDVDVSGKTIVELSLLRNEIFARNGYLFDDAVLRGYFNEFEWYQPIFDVPDFKVELDSQEQAFVNKVLALEKKLSEYRYLKQGKYAMIDMDHVYNLVQFKSIDDKLKEALAQKNFAILPATHGQFFHVYDNNHYQYIPNFVTTDIYLQVLHKHFSTLLGKIEEEKLAPVLSQLLIDLAGVVNQFAVSSTDPQLTKAAQWSATYLAIARHLMIGDDVSAASPDPHLAIELRKIRNAEGRGSPFLDSPLFQYSQFKPRGNYAKSAALQSYFRCVKWLNTAPISIAENQRFLSSLIIAAFIKSDPGRLSAFRKYNEVITFIVGQEDNMSISNLINLISDDEARSPSLLNNQTRLDDLREQLSNVAIDRINPKGGDRFATDELSKRAVLFTAARYTFDAEIMSRLIHVLRPDQRRTFPKALDVFASLGNEEAQNILLSEYKEGAKWTQYPDSLNKMKRRFASFSSWEESIYTKSMQTITSLDNNSDDFPLFMKTEWWDKKNLITSLAAWTELKHDMLLYSEQPFAAQAGQGGGPPPPQQIGYVEPNVKFWEAALNLIDFQEKRLREMDVLPEHVQGINRKLKEIATKLLQISQKELAGEALTSDELDYISWIGGEIEYLTFRIFETDHLPEQEKHVALIADVYNYNGEFLEQAVGKVDEIYVVAEINGKPYLTKGAVFSYYEFRNDRPMTDDEWRGKLDTGDAPERPIWVKEIMVDAPSLESKPGNSF